MSGRYVVHCVEKTRVGEYDVIDKFHIRYDVGNERGEVGAVWNKEEMLEKVKAGEEFYVLDRRFSSADRDRLLRIDVSDDGNEYLTTGADSLSTNNLGGVPVCSNE